MNEPTAWVMSATILRSLYDIAAATTATTVGVLEVELGDEILARGGLLAHVSGQP